MIPVVTRATATLTANQTSFTVGTGGNINIPRPGLQQIDRIAFVDTATTPDLEFSLGKPITEAEWENIPMKALTSTYPQKAYYSPTYAASTGTLYPWPIPTSSTLLWAIYYYAPVAEFAAVTDAVTVPDGYERLLVTNLALELAPSNNRQPAASLVMAARDSLAVAKKANARAVELCFDSGLTRGGYYNIYTGE